MDAGRDGKDVQFTVNKKSTRVFQRAVIARQPRFYTAPNFLKMGIKYLNLSSIGQFWQ